MSKKFTSASLGQGQIINKELGLIVFDVSFNDGTSEKFDIYFQIDGQTIAHMVPPDNLKAAFANDPVFLQMQLQNAYSQMQGTLMPEIGQSFGLGLAVTLLSRQEAAKEVNN